jgi:hypothetical protein
MPVVQFAQFSSIVQPTFWHELSRLKLEVLRLSDETVPITATYSTGRTVKDRNTGREVALGCNIALGGEGFSESYRCVYLRVGMYGCSLYQPTPSLRSGSGDLEESQHNRGVQERRQACFV